MSNLTAYVARKGYARTDVTVAGITDETDEQVTDLALTTARETRDRLFGTKVTRFDDTTVATVSLYTD